MPAGLLSCSRRFSPPLWSPRWALAVEPRAVYNGSTVYRQQAAISALIKSHPGAEGGRLVAMSPEDALDGDKLRQGPAAGPCHDPPSFAIGRDTILLSRSSLPSSLTSRQFPPGYGAMCYGDDIRGTRRYMKYLWDNSTSEFSLRNAGNLDLSADRWQIAGRGGAGRRYWTAGTALAFDRFPIFLFLPREPRKSPDVPPLGGGSLLCFGYADICLLTSTVIPRAPSATYRWPE
ncbi:hypothetical protein KM043_010609 [Ampulex compressa]|nr:hypothetical protein KM043_010609 [Ampulex compressa]